MSREPEEPGRWPMTMSAYAKGLVLVLGVPFVLVLLYLLLSR